MGEVIDKHISDKELISQIYKGIIKHNSKKNQIKNGQN